MKKQTQHERNKSYKQYILSCIDSEAYEVTTTTEQEKITFLFETFKKEHWQKDHQKYYDDDIKRSFTDWLRGLPSVFTIEFENYKIIELAEKINGETYETEKSQDKILNNYWRFITNHCFMMFFKYNLLEA